jgi:hypothetical protein
MGTSEKSRRTSGSGPVNIFADAYQPTRSVLMDGAIGGTMSGGHQPNQERQFVCLEAGWLCPSNQN